LQDFFCVAGDRAGTSEVIAELPGFPDNLCTDADGIVWVAFAPEPNPGLEAIHNLPFSLRRLVARLPERALPKPSRVACERRMCSRVQVEG
jgi:hypothetical protein